MDLITHIKKDNNETVSGFAIVGKNSSGKTYNLNNLFRKLVEDPDMLNGKFSYKKSNVLYFSKEMNVKKIRCKNVDRFDNELSSFETLLDNGTAKYEINIQNDSINVRGTQYAFFDVIFETIIENIDYYTILFKDMLGFEIKVNLGLEKDIGESVYELESDITDFLIDDMECTSTGYLFLIRLIVLLDNLLTNQIDWLFIDEPDADLDTQNASIILNLISRMKKRKNSKAKVVVITHNIDTLFGVSDKYIIYKLPNNENDKIEKYYSQDFFNKSQMEKALFDNICVDVYKSNIMKELVSIYRQKLEDTTYEFNEIKYEYKNLSNKEKILFNAINRLGDC